METVPQCRDNPAPARRSHAPTRADPNNTAARGLTPAANDPCRQLSGFPSGNNR